MTSLSKEEIEVIQFVSNWGGIPPEKVLPNKSLYHDLGIAGDDGDELLFEYSKHFKVSVQYIDAFEYFGAEGGYLFWMILEMFSREKKRTREPKRLTIKDLVDGVKSGTLLKKSTVE